MADKKYTKKTEIGKQYSFLKIIDFQEHRVIDGKQINSTALVKCQNCESKPFIVTHHNLITNNTKSCGCLKVETALKRIKYTKETEIGKIYNFLKIIEFEESKTINGEKKSPKAIVKCQNCNSDPFLVWHINLVSGHTKSCGCLLYKIMSDRKIYTKEIEIGKQYNSLKIIDFYENDGKKRSTALVKCQDCNSEPFITLHNNLVQGTTKTCGGCCKKNNKYALKHGLRHTNLYKRFMGINSRCYNPKATSYKYYGARGIKNFWKDNLIEFIDYIKNNLGEKPGPNYTIDRIDNDKDYCPGNIRWATHEEQAFNKSKPHEREIDALKLEIIQLKKEVNQLKEKLENFIK